MPPLAYSRILCKFITCLVPRVVAASRQEAQEDIGTSLGLQQYPASVYYLPCPKGR